MCETLKNAGITPITIGAANKWTSAAWFDYLNLRINGLDYHQRLLQGEIPFPQINPAIPAYEEAPMDLLMVPNYTKMNKTVEHYLLSIAGLDFQKRYNDVSSMISPNKQVQSKDDYFIQQGQKVLNNAAGLSQFFDRDTNEKMGRAGTVIFTEFMDSKNVDATLSALENAR